MRRSIDLWHGQPERSPDLGNEEKGNLPALLNDPHQVREPDLRFALPEKAVI